MDGRGEFIWPDGRKYNVINIISYYSLYHIISYYHRVIMLKTRNKDMVNSHGQMVESILDNGSMANNMDKETTSIHREKRKQAYGKMERETHGLNKTTSYDFLLIISFIVSIHTWLRFININRNIPIKFMFFFKVITKYYLLLA